jgi:Asp-tRNA(Asn)/Glu-tRNA(Gln) amidotransferase A subunit family amidase
VLNCNNNLLDGPCQPVIRKVAANKVMSIVDLHIRIERGELTPSAAIQQSLASISEIDPAVRAFVIKNSRAALAAATSRSGPLSGIAVGVKDILDTADMPTEMGSPIYCGWRPRADAGLVMLARKAGASILGKTATSAFAHDDLPPTRNPVDLRYLPGGSSSGSAAAVGAGMVPLAFGTQTGGSTIRPASFCGTAAIKPSSNLLPISGQKCLCPSLDTPGLFTSTVLDLAFALSALTGRDLRIPHISRPLQIGVTHQVFAGSAEPASDAALQAAIRALESAGATVIDKQTPPEFATAWERLPILADCEALHSLAWEWETHRDLIPPKLSTALSNAEKLKISEFDEARCSGLRARYATDGFFSDLDAIITFSAPGVAPKELDSTGDARFNRLWTLLGVPCVNVPGYRASDGMPVGIQVVAAFGADAMALGVAMKLEGVLRGRAD